MSAKTCRCGNPVTFKSPRSTTCLDCNREACRKWREANPERHKYLQRRASLRRNYGIEPEDYDAILESQNGLCAICGTDNPNHRHKSNTFVVDHCHETGKVRGLLCQGCNLLLGHSKESGFVLESAIRYLEAA